MTEQSAHELLNFIDRRIAVEQDKDDPLTRGYLLALRHMKEHIENEEKYECDKEVD
jgi:hypothetical protein